ncbi:MAG: 4-hydroxy-tetrahydrodipicolinate synthase [Thermoprotei archaeon]|nr:MAG: 4-hydroxy-tetrahydrodipicolinate synthase [Thermoprotei archaeon]
MSKPMFYGVIVPLITPFNEDLSIDFDAVRWLVRYLAEHGVHGVFPCSTTGEFVHLKPEECIELVKVVLEEVRGKVKVIPGISANCTDHCIELGRKMRDLGVDGVIATPPYFFKVSYEKLRLHFSKIAEKVDLPLMIYNIPATTGINVPISLYVELAKEYSNVVGAKVTYDSVTYMRKLIQEAKSVRKDFSVLTGLDDHLLYTLMMGGDGGIVALANVVPQIHVALYRAWAEGNLERAYTMFVKLLKLVQIYDIASTYPTAVKTALKVLGTPVKPYVRPPLTPEPPEVEEKIRKVLEDLSVKTLPK